MAWTNLIEHYGEENLTFSVTKDGTVMTPEEMTTDGVSYELSANRLTLTTPNSFYTRYAVLVTVPEATTASVRVINVDASGFTGGMIEPGAGQIDTRLYHDALDPTTQTFAGPEESVTPDPATFTDPTAWTAIDVGAIWSTAT